MTGKRDPVLAGVPGRRIPAPLVTMTVWRPGVPLPPVKPMPVNPLSDHEKLHFGPVHHE
jgi:hypothetical protein